MRNMHKIVLFGGIDMSAIREMIWSVRRKMFLRSRRAKAAMRMFEMMDYQERRYNRML